MRRLLQPFVLFRRHYGANPLQLLALLACFAGAGYVFFLASMGPLPVRMLVWFVAAVVGHDLVLYPLYALADSTWHVGARRLRAARRGRPPRVPAINHVRVPVVLSGMVLIAFWGTISGQGDDHFAYAAGHRFVDYLARWLILTGVLFGVSAVLYAWRLRKSSPAPARRPSPTKAAP